MTKEEKELVEKICKNVNSPLRPQIETVVKTILALQKKLEEHYDEYLEQPMSVVVTVGTGETVHRTNPFCAEYRSTLKDYIFTIQQLNKLVDDVSVEEEINALSSIKDKIRLVK